MGNEEEKKEILDEQTADDQNEGDNVNEYIRKFAICSEISKLRALYIMNGGRMGGKLNDEHLRADLSLDEFNQRQNEWNKRLMDWNDRIFKLRDDSHSVLCYFTINKTRIIIEQLNEYRKSLKNKKKKIIIPETEEKKEDNVEPEMWQCPGCTLIDGNFLNNPRCIACNEWNPNLPEDERATFEENKLQKVQKQYLFERLLSHFHFINPKLSQHAFKKLLKKWRHVEPNTDDALKYFEQFFDDERILNVQELENENKHNLNVGQP